MIGIYPPDPTQDGWHYISWEYGTYPWQWVADRAVWMHDDDGITPSDLADFCTYVCPVPQPDQLAAMGEIMGFFSAALLEHELVDGPVADDAPIWTGAAHHITAGMIRRAIGKGKADEKILSDP